jgi:hypothetical protein
LREFSWLKTLAERGASADAEKTPLLSPLSPSVSFSKTVLRLFLLLLGAGAFVFGVFYFCAYLARPDMQAKPRVYSAAELEAAIRVRDNSLDQENPPVVYREVDYSEGRNARWFPRGESPIIRGLVEEGKLPPVEERVPAEPVVLEGPEGIGRYGGTWYWVGIPGFQAVDSRMSAPTLVRWSPQG